MGWRTVVINIHSKLSYKNNYLVFTSADKKEVIHLSEIDNLIVESTEVSITSMLLKRLIDEKINVIFCDDKRMPISVLMPFYGRYDSSLQIKKQIEWPQNMKDEVWINIINQKLYNQASLLGKLDYKTKSKKIHEIRQELMVADPSNGEAHSARIYFNTLFGHTFTRKSDSDINAGLNYGYSMILSLVAREVVLNGCITQLGLMHTNQFNDYNLASDLMEPFRIIVDEKIYESMDKSFREMKIRLFDIFNETYTYNNSQVYLTNIIEDYVRKIIKILNGENIKFPEFII